MSIGIQTPGECLLTALVIAPRLTVGFVLAGTLPMTPLVLTVIPFIDLIKKIIGMLL